MYVFSTGSQAIAAAAKKAGVKFFGTIDSKLTDTFRVVYDEIKSAGYKDRFADLITCNAEDIISAAYAATEAGMPSVCILTEYNSGAIRSFDVCSGFSYIVICDEISDKTLYAVHTEKISCLIPQTIQEVHDYVYKSVIISELTGVPVAVIVPKRLMRINATVDMNIVNTRGPLQKPVRRTIREDMLKSETACLNNISCKGKYGIAGNGITYLKAKEALADISDIRFFNLDYVCDGLNGRIEEFKKSTEHILLITDSLRLRELFGDDENVMLLQTDSDEDLCNRIRKWLPRDRKAQIKRFGYQWDNDKPYIVKPSESLMCPGCVYRTKVYNGIQNSDEDCLICEDYYCNIKGLTVKSGITDERLRTSESAAMLKAGYHLLSTKNLLYLNDTIEQCNPDTDLMVEDSISWNSRMKILNVICTGCGKCITQTGCPAIWSKGFEYHIDSSMCTACGLCRKVCKEEAIVCTHAEM